MSALPMHGFRRWCRLAPWRTRPRRSKSARVRARSARATALGLGILLQVAGCSGGPARQVMLLPQVPLERADLASDLDTLAVGDSLAFRFPYRADLDQRVAIRADGRVALPFAGSVQALGRTAGDIESELRQRYKTLAYDPTRAVGDKQYLLNTGDRLEIRFRDAEKLNADVMVRPDGKISLSLVKTIVAEGKTPEQLEKELIRAYSAFLTNPDLVVIVRQFTSERFYVDGRLTRPGVKDLDDLMVTVQSFAPRQVFVAGEVRNPGFVRYEPPLTALEAIIGAGGFIRSAELARVLVLRRGTTSPAATFINLRQDVHGRASNDMALRPFDIVIVPKSRITQVTDFLDQYLYQLVPAARNVNFGFFYNLNNLNK